MGRALLNIVLGPSGQIQVAMDASDAVSLIVELGKVADEDSTITNQLLDLLKTVLIKKL